MNELTLEGFKSLNMQAEAALSIRERTVTALVWETDEYGDRVQKRVEVPSGPELFPKGEISETLLKALQAPCSAKSLVQQLDRLKAHKNYCMGNESWRIILQDLSKDLAGCSEYAVIKTSEYFRQLPEKDLKFFPDTGDLQRRIKDLDFSLRNLNAAKPVKPEEKRPPDFTPDGLAKRVAVANYMHDNGYHNNMKNDLCERCKANDQMEIDAKAVSAGQG